MPAAQLTMTVLMTPDMANFSGKVHGGSILKLLDQVAYACASRYAARYVVMGAQVEGFFGDTTGLIGYVRSGKLKAIGVASAKRHPALPDVKTLAEQGIPNVDTNNWYALFAPAKTPPATVQALSEAVRRALADPTVRARLLDTGADPAPSTPAELAAVLKRDTDKWAKLIHDKKIKAE